MTQALLQCQPNTQLTSTSKQLDILMSQIYRSTTLITQFKKMCSLLRPGYKGHSAKYIGDSILDTVQKEVKTECRDEVKNSTMCMSLEGWSNIHNEPLVCGSIVTLNGESIFLDCCRYRPRTSYRRKIKESCYKSYTTSTRIFSSKNGEFCNW